MNQLEQRLVETEAALYGALATLRGMHPTTVVKASAKPDSSAPKSARMNEWSRLPLRTWPEIERWQTAVSDHFTLEQMPQATQAGTPNSGNLSMHESTGHVYGTLEGAESASLGYALPNHQTDLSTIDVESSMRPHPNPSGMISDKHSSPVSAGDPARCAAPADQLGHTEAGVTRPTTRAEELSKISGIYF